MDQHSKAEGIYKYATDLDPHHAIAWYNRGLTLQALGRWQESRDCQLNALRDHYLTGTPAMESIASTLAACFVKLGDAKSGCRLLSELVGSGPHPLAQQLAEYLSDSGEPGKAIDVLKQQHPADLEAWYKDAVGALALNNNFRQSDLLSRLLTIQNFTVPKHPRVQEGFHNAIKAAMAQIKAKDDGPASMLELDGLGMYSIMALREGCQFAACRVKSWDVLTTALRRTFMANGCLEHQAQIQEYVPSSSGGEDPLAEIPQGCKLVVQGVNCPASVPLLIQRMQTFQAAGMLTVPKKGALKVMGIQCDQLHHQTNVGPVVSGFDVSNFGDFCTAIRKYNLNVHLHHADHVQLSEVVTVDVAKGINELSEMKVKLPIKTAGRLDAIATWYDFELFDGIELSMGPASDGLWKQNIQMVHLDQDVAAGESVEMDIVVTRWAKDYTQQWIMFDDIGVAREEKAPTQTHQTALNSFDALGGAVWHFDMMSDLKRNDAYERALIAAVKPGSIVLDIGTGSGLLAMMAARAGAKHVYACEMNPDVAEKAKAVIKANGLEDRITVYGKRSTDIHVGAELPAPVDVVVTETMGTDLLSEAMYFSLHDAVKRLTTPDVVLIPSTGRVLAQLIEVPERWHMDGFAIPKEGGLDMRPLNTLLPNFWSMVQMKKIKYVALSDVTTLFDFDFSVPYNPKGLLDTLKVPLIASGRLHAVVIWWDSILGRDGDEDIIIETGPESRYASTDHAHWSQMMQILSFDGVPVTAGESIPLRVYTDNHMTFCELTEQ
uniref:Protein arginine N-methyltransferase domain-containing protein n=1 Tax=Eutreptiella gymnastica TaxID=73025 RepID=A0A7S4LI65_9EUGL